MPSGTHDAELTWAASLDAMERHVEELRAGLERRAPMPEPYEVTAPRLALPASLADRARQLKLAQDDVEVALRERVGMLAAVLQGPVAAPRVASTCYVDRRV